MNNEQSRENKSKTNFIKKIKNLHKHYSSLNYIDWRIIDIYDNLEKLHNLKKDILYYQIQETIIIQTWKKTKNKKRTNKHLFFKIE